MVFASLSTGLRKAFAGKKFILLILLINLLIAVLFMGTYTGAYQQFFRQRIATEKLAQANLYQYLAEFYKYKSQAVAASRAEIRLGIFLMLFLSIFFAGGMVAFFVSREPSFNMRQFLSQSGNYLGRMLRIFLLQLVFLIIAIFIFYWLQKFAKLFLGDYSPFHSRVYWFFANVTITFLILNIFLLWLDYTKIILVSENQNSVLTAMRRALLFFKNHFRGTYFLHLVMWILLIAGVGFQLYIIYNIPKSSSGTISLAFFVLQLFVFYRWWMKWSIIGAQYHYFQMQEK